MTEASLLASLRPRRVSLFRALQLGDLLCAVPALRALRAALPDAEITLIGLPWASGFARRFDRYLDRFLAFPGHPALPEQPADLARFPAFLADAQAARFDLAIQLHGSGSVTNPLVQLLGARQVAGFCVSAEESPAPAWFRPWPAAGSEVAILLGLMTFLGAPDQGHHLEFPLLPDDETERERVSREAGLVTGAYVCVHPGARLRSRRWPVERFAAVADALAERGLTVVLTGSAGETGLTAAVAERMRRPSVDLAGRTSLGGLAALVRSARLVVCNDTGVSHIAAAVGTPSVVVASGSDVTRWAPRDWQRHRVLAVPVPCRPCAFETCPIDHPCATGVSTAAVIEMTERLLDQSLVTVT